MEEFDSTMRFEVKIKKGRVIINFDNCWAGFDPLI